MTEDAQNLFRLDRRHINAVVEPLVRAFHNDPLWTALLPDPAERARRTGPVFRFMLRFGLLTGEVRAPSPRLEGAAVWLPARHADPGGLPALRCGALAIPFHIGLAHIGPFRALGKAVSAIRKQHAPADYRYLAMLGIAPEHQGRGLGAALLETMLARSDRKRIPVWLETETEDNVRFYRKRGFRVVAEFTVPQLNVPMWALLRPAP